MTRRQAKYASIHICKHLHGVNYESIEHFTSPVSVVFGGKTVLVHFYEQLGMAFIFFFSESVKWRVIRRGKKRLQCLCGLGVTQVEASKFFFVCIFFFCRF